MGSVFGLVHGNMLKMLQRAFNVSRHGHVTSTFFVIPSEGYAAIPAASPVEADFIYSFEGRNEMFGVGPIGVPAGRQNRQQPK